MSCIPPKNVTCIWNPRFWGKGWVLSAAVEKENPEILVLGCRLLITDSLKAELTVVTLKNQVLLGAGAVLSFVMLKKICASLSGSLHDRYERPYVHFLIFHWIWKLSENIIPLPGHCSKSSWHLEKKKQAQQWASSLFKLGNHTVCLTDSQGRQASVNCRWNRFNKGLGIIEWVFSPDPVWMTHSWG